MPRKAYLHLWCTTLLYWLGLNGLMSVLPLHLQAVGYSGALIGWVLGAASLGALLSRLFLGSAVDRYGSRPFLMGAGLLIALATLAAEPALGAPGMILAMIMVGISVSFLLTGGLAAAAAAATPERRGAALSWYGLTNSVAAMVAAPILIPIFTSRGFDFVQVVVAGSGILVALLSLLVKSRVEQAATRSPRPRAVILPSAVRPALVGAAVAVTAGAFGLVGPLKAAALGLVNPGLYLTVQAAALFLSRMAFALVSDRWGRGWVIGPGLVSLAAGYCLIGLITDPFWAMSAPALIGIGLGAAGAGLLPWTVDRAGTDQRGLAINTFYLFWELALFLGETAVGFLLTIGEAWAYTGVASVAIAGLFYLLVPLRERASIVAKTE